MRRGPVRPCVTREYPEVPIVVTGDSGIMLAPLLKAGISKSNIHHEQEATSTVENATFTDPILAELGAKKVVLVTNWFHAPRSLAVFRRHQPEREFAAAFEPKPDKMSNWHRYASRRERLQHWFIWSETGSGRSSRCAAVDPPMAEVRVASSS